jgi:hypothetical protein
VVAASAAQIEKLGPQRRLLCESRQKATYHIEIELTLHAQFNCPNLALWRQLYAQSLASIKIEEKILFALV